MKSADTAADRLACVSVSKKANVYEGGRCVSHTVYVEGGARKSIGLILPGTLDFDTASPERMEIVAGRCRVRLAGSETTREYGPGQEFSVPASSRFRIEALEPLHYVCHFG